MDLTPRQGTYLIGVVNMLASLMCTQTVRYFGRVTLAVWGHALIAVTHFLIGYLNVHHENTGVLISLLSFIVIYQNTSGPVAWIYAAETVIDVALGLCLFVLWGCVFVLSLVCPVLMSSPADGGIGASNMFFAFSGLSVFGSLYCKYFFIETQGKTDKEKKTIFTPKKYLEESGESRQGEERKPMIK